MIAIEKDERESPQDFHEGLLKMRSMFMLFCQTLCKKKNRLVAGRSEEHPLPVRAPKYPVYGHQAWRESITPNST